MLLERQNIDGDPVRPDSTVPTVPLRVSGPNASSRLLRSSFQKCDPETVGLVSCASETVSCSKVVIIGRLWNRTTPPAMSLNIVAITCELLQVSGIACLYSPHLLSWCAHSRNKSS